MKTFVARSPGVVDRHVFPTWSIEVPPTLEETFVKEGNYWHAWDGERSVSLTSITISDADGPVSAAEILDRMTPGLLRPHASSICELPRGLHGWATWGPIEQPARAD